MEDDHSMDEEWFSASNTISEEFKRKAYKWCVEYLGGIWLRSFYDQFEIRYLEGGLTNYLYICRLDLKDSDNILLEANESELKNMKVVLRIYGEIVDSKTKFFEGVIFNVMSERNIGPKLLGAFPAGRIEEFIDTVPITYEDFIGCRYVEKVAAIIANYHAMELPTSKVASKFLDTIFAYKLYFYRNIQGSIKSSVDPTHVEMLTRFNSYDWNSEIKWLFNFLKNSYSPTVFCHNDLQEGNILNSDSNLVLIDYEYSCYHYRGYDLGNHFCEYIYKNNAPENVHGFVANFDNYPSKEQQLVFSNAYLDAIRNNHKLSDYTKKQFLVTPEALIEEANRYSLASHLYWMFWAFIQYKVSKIKFGYLEYAISRLDGYFYFKKKFGYD